MKLKVEFVSGPLDGEVHLVQYTPGDCIPIDMVLQRNPKLEPTVLACRYEVVGNLAIWRGCAEE